MSTTSSHFSDAKIQLASGNYEAQEHFFARLFDAFKMSGLKYEDVADELGVSVSDAQEWLMGEVDLSLSELRQLANTIDAKVSYKVGALHTTYASRLPEMVKRTNWVEKNDDWKPPRRRPAVQS